MTSLVSIFQSSTAADSGISSKRVITFLAFIFCSIAFFANIFFGYSVDPHLYDGMMYIVIGGLGVTVAERFAKPNSKQDKEL